MDSFCQYSYKIQGSSQRLPFQHTHQLCQQLFLQSKTNLVFLYTDLSFYCGSCVMQVALVQSISHITSTYLNSSQKQYHHHQFHHHHRHHLQYHLLHVAELPSSNDENEALYPARYLEQLRLLQHPPVIKLFYQMNQSNCIAYGS